MTSIRFQGQEDVLRHVVVATRNIIEAQEWEKAAPRFPNQPHSEVAKSFLDNAGLHLEAAMMDPSAKGFLTHIGDFLDKPVELRDIGDFETTWQTTSLRQELGMQQQSTLTPEQKHDVGTKVVTALTNTINDFIEHPFNFSVKPERFIPSGLSLMLGPIKALLLTLIPPAPLKP